MILLKLLRALKTMMNNKLPFVTIITVVFNGENYIEETIQSVINQTYNNYEYIIIDGGSVDGTIEIINRHSDKITRFISEPDKGIYDAMNKGIREAKGEWFNFLNASDSFIDNYVLEKIFSSELNDATLIYGDIRVLGNNGQSHYHQAINLVNDKSLIRGMKVCHQAIFYNQKILNLYDVSLQLKSEWKHLIQITRHPFFRPLKFNFPFVYYRLGGLSATEHKLVRKEYNKVFLEEYGLLNYVIFYPFFIYMAVRYYSKRMLLKLRIMQNNLMI